MGILNNIFIVNVDNTNKEKIIQKFLLFHQKQKELMLNYIKWVKKYKYFL